MTDLEHRKQKAEELKKLKESASPGKWNYIFSDPEVFSTLENGWFTTIHDTTTRERRIADCRTACFPTPSDNANAKYIAEIHSSSIEDWFLEAVEEIERLKKLNPDEVQLVRLKSD